MWILPLPWHMTGVCLTIKGTLTTVILSDIMLILQICKFQFCTSPLYAWLYMFFSPMKRTFIYIKYILLFLLILAKSGHPSRFWPNLPPPPPPLWEFSQIWLLTTSNIDNQKDRFTKTKRYISSYKSCIKNVEKLIFMHSFFLIPCFIYVSCKTMWPSFK